MSFNYKTQMNESIGRLSRIRSSLLDQVDNWQRSKKSIMCFGASQSTSTLVHLLGIEDHIACYIDDNPFKLLTYSPLGNRVVISTEMMLTELVKGKYIAVVMGGWRFSDMWIKRYGLDRYDNLTLFKPVLGADSKEA